VDSASAISPRSPDRRRQ